MAETLGEYYGSKKPDEKASSSGGSTNRVRSGDDDIQAITDRILGAGPVAQDQYTWDEFATDALRAFYTGDGMQNPETGHVIYKGGYDTGRGRLTGSKAISYLQKRLIAAGLLDPEDITMPGSPADPYTRRAMADLLDSKDILGVSTLQATFDSLSRDFKGWDKVNAEKKARIVYSPPDRRIAAEEDVIDIARARGRQIMGHDPAQKQLDRVLRRTRAEEQREYQGELAAYNRDYAIAQYEQDLTDTKPSGAAVTIEQAASPDAIATEQFLRSEAGLKWSVLQGILALRNDMRNG